MFKRDMIIIPTSGRGLYECTEKVDRFVREQKIDEALCTVFLEHTSASLIICENADPTVQTDVLAYFERLFPDGDPRYRHQFEGEDDMSAHLRTILTQCSLTLPVSRGRLALGTWQGLFLFEHRTVPHHRRLSVTVFA